MTMGLPPRAMTVEISVSFKIEQLSGGVSYKLTLLVGVERLLEDLVTGEDHDNGEVLVNQGQNTVLQLTGHDSLAVEVGNFLDLQRTLKGGGELATTAKQQQGLLVLEYLLAQILDGLVQLENVLDLGRDIAKTLDDFLSANLLGSTVLAKGEGKHDHGNELGGVGLGGGNTDFGTSVDVDTAVGKEGDGRTDNVDDTDGESTALQAVAESHQRISSLTRLRNEDASVVSEDRSLTIKEIRG